MNIHYGFDEYREAFKKFYELKKADAAVNLVISTQSYTSGYWLEKDSTEDENTFVYRDTNEVQKLEKRIKRKLNRCDALGSYGVII